MDLVPCLKDKFYLILNFICFCTCLFAYKLIWAYLVLLIYYWYCFVTLLINLDNFPNYTSNTFSFRKYFKSFFALKCFTDFHAMFGLWGMWKKGKENERREDISLILVSMKERKYWGIRGKIFLPGPTKSCLPKLSRKRQNNDWPITKLCGGKFPNMPLSGFPFLPISKHNYALIGYKGGKRREKKRIIERK